MHNALFQSVQVLSANLTFDFSLQLFSCIFGLCEKYELEHKVIYSTFSCFPGSPHAFAYSVVRTCVTCVARRNYRKLQNSGYSASPSHAITVKQKLNDLSMLTDCMSSKKD